MAFGSLAASACAAGQQSVATRNAATNAKTLTYQVSSWGKPEQYWQVNPDGKGEIRIYTQGAGFYDYTVQRYHIDVTPEGYEGVRSEVADFISGRIKKIPCKNMMTDAPYGSLGWAGGAKDGAISFNYGCMDSGANKIFERFQKAGVALREMMVQDAEPFAVETSAQPIQ